MYKGNNKGSVLTANMQMTCLNKTFRLTIFCFYSIEIAHTVVLMRTCREARNKYSEKK